MVRFLHAPERYLDLMRAGIGLYDRLQDEVVAACPPAARVLDLGVGTGETSRRYLNEHGAGAVIAIDQNAEMLGRAEETLDDRVTLVRQRLEDPLPDGPFDLVYSALAIHHLDSPGKADLFKRVAAVLAPGARFVFADVVVPDAPVANPTPLVSPPDQPSRLDDQLRWLADAGLHATVTWTQEDLVVVACTLRWPAPHARLVGDLVELVPLQASHEQALYEVSRGEEELWRWLLGTPPTRDGFAAYFAATLGQAARGLEQPYCTVLRATGEPVGTSRFMAIRSEHLSIEIGGTWVARPAWRTGANVEAKLLMLTRAFEVLGAERVELKTDARNERSRAAMAALPAQFEGIWRRHMITPYGPRDSAYFSVIASEWPDVKANLRRRLAR